MRKPELVLIAAVSRNNVIGIEGKIPWHKEREKNRALIKDDFEHFKGLTMGYPIIMGRVTYQSIPQKFRPLPGRQNVVLTRDPSFRENGVYVAPSLEDALDVLGDRGSYVDVDVDVDGIDYSKIFIGGGQQVYEAAMHHATSLEITHVDQHVEGLEMRYFPKIDRAVWKETKSEAREGFSFATYMRR